MEQYNFSKEEIVNVFSVECTINKISSQLLLCTLLQVLHFYFKYLSAYNPKYFKIASQISYRVYKKKKEKSSREKQINK